MKKLFLTIVTLFCVVSGFAQVNLGQNSLLYKAELFKTYTNFTATSDDTTGWVTVPVTEVLAAREVILLGISTDSIQANVYVVGRNDILTNITTTVTDSITTLGAGATAWSSTNPKTKVITLKTNGTNNLPGCTQFKVGTVFGVAGSQGTTTGRTMKWYLYYLK